MAADIANQILPLEDIIAPNSVSIWPLALGWWLLLAMIIALVIGVFILYKNYKKKWSYRKEALSLLKNTQNTLDEKATINNYLECLKRTAISAYPAHNINALYGKDWVDFLNQQTPTPLFTDELARFICESQYQKAISIDKQYVYTAVKSWIKKHSTQVQPNSMNTDKEVA